MDSVPHRAALHVSASVAIVAVVLAVSALVHSLSIIRNTGHRQLLLIALIAWPILTGVPAFVLDLCASYVLVRFRLTQASGR
jgi:hypothetical protein